MGLDTPLALLGMLAAALPLLAHRMKKRDLPRVQLPTFALLAKAAAQSRARRTLQDLLLLILRIATLCVASLAIAAPYVTARVPFGDGRVAALTIVIDDSLSMARADRGKSLFAQAVERAASIGAMLPPGSDVAVVLAGKPARVLAPLDKDTGKVVDQLEALADRATRAGDLDGAVLLAARELSRSDLPVRRLLLLSDFAKHATLDSNLLNIDGVDLAAERVGQAPTMGNVYIDSISAAADPTQPGTTSIAVELRSKGAVSGNAKLDVVRAGTAVASAAVTLQDGTAKAVLHVPTPDGADDPRAQVVLRTSDALEADNTAGVVLTHADAMRVLLVDGDPHPASDADELRYLSPALAAVPASMLQLVTRSVDALGLAHVQFGDHDVVVLANVPTPPPEVVTRLRTFVERGGGLIVAAGTQVEAAAYNAAFGNLLASHISGMAPSQDEHLSLPEGARWLEHGLLGLHEASTTRRLLLEPCRETLLSFTDGRPALCAADVGTGRTLLLATTLDADFTDLPMRPGFLPLMASMLRSVAGAAGAARGQFFPGEGIDLPVSRGAAAIDVVAPSGEVHKLTPRGNDPTLRFTSTTEIGAYRVRAHSRDNPDESIDRGAFIVRAPTHESDLTAGSVPDASSAQAKAQTAGVHRSLAPLFFALVGLLVLAEGFVRLRRKPS